MKFKAFISIEFVNGSPHYYSVDQLIVDGDIDDDLFFFEDFNVLNEEVRDDGEYWTCVVKARNWSSAFDTIKSNMSIHTIH